MRRIIAATSTNESYYPIARNLLVDLGNWSEVENWCLTLDFLPAELPLPINYRMVDTRDLRAPLNNWCIQHGEFTPYIPGAADDVILFMDADLRMQRPFYEEEYEDLEWLRDGEFFVGYNAGPSDTLEAEGHRLGYKLSQASVMKMFPGIYRPCYNVGCMAASRASWEKLCEDYINLWPMVNECFQHVAKQQWLISWLLSDRYTVIEMPTSFHCHGHYSLEWTGCRKEGELVYKGNDLVLFRHKVR